MLTAFEIKWIATVVSTIISGLVAVGATVAIERLGGLVGGVLVSTPTTVVPSVLGVTFSGASNNDVLLFALNYPPPMVLNSGVLFSWKFVNDRLPSTWTAKKRLFTLISSVLTFWFLGALLIVGGLEQWLKIPQLYLAVACMVIHVIFGFSVLFLSPAASPKGKNKVTPFALALRGLCAASVILIGSLIARADPSLGGFVSCFPAIYLTTLISVQIAQGDKVATGATGPMILGGFSVSIFSLSYALLYPQFGWASAAIMGYLIAVLSWSMPLGFFLRWWNNRNAALATSTTVDPDSLALPPSDVPLDSSSTSSSPAMSTSSELEYPKTSVDKMVELNHVDLDHDDDDVDPNVVKINFGNV